MESSDESLGVPAFLCKLWKMVEDPETDDLICWSKDGKSFIIRNEIEFWYKLLPVYYKHNNMSSFVRQLNMYGFHKVVHYDKVEYRFYHPYFQSNKPELLKNIKRKNTTSTKIVSSANKAVNNIEDQNQWNKIFMDVNYLQSRQAHVDSVLNNLKQENSVLWRELAMLRQKHQKQQQIVNKLIQFLVTIVQPSTRMSGLSVKRGYPLMLNESPKKRKKDVSGGPTIHELDSTEVEVVPDIAQIDSTASTSQSSQCNCDLLNEIVDIPIEPEILLDTSDLELNKVTNGVTDELLSIPDVSQLKSEGNSDVASENDFEDVFLNTSSQDKLLTNLISGSNNSDVLNDEVTKTDAAVAKDDNSKNMTVATRDPNLRFNRLNSFETLNNHVGATKSELEELREFISGCNSIDNTYILNLFNELPAYGLAPRQNKEETIEGTEVAPYDSDILNFNELLSDSMDGSDFVLPDTIVDTNCNTPEALNLQPTFPTSK